MVKNEFNVIKMHGTTKKIPEYNFVMEYLETVRLVALNVGDSKSFVDITTIVTCKT